jgi:integrase
VYRNLSLTRHRIEELTKVKVFLDSIGRNSRESRNAYHRGLVHFQNFLDEIYPTITVESILQPLVRGEINVYELLDNFVPFLIKLKLAVNSITLYMTAVRSYLAYYDIDIIPAKFKRKVKMPKVCREDEEPIDARDIRKILLSCNNRRLKTFILILASGGMRTREALATRLQDIDFSVTPTKIHIRKEFAKTKAARDIYVSDEATHYLKQWLDWKYRDKGIEWTKTPNTNDLVFAVNCIVSEPNPSHIYVKIIMEFEKLLTIVGMDERKEGMKREKLLSIHFVDLLRQSLATKQTKTIQNGFLAIVKVLITQKRNQREERSMLPNA